MCVTKMPQLLAGTKCLYVAFIIMVFVNFKDEVGTLSKGLQY